MAEDGATYSPYTWGAEDSSSGDEDGDRVAFSSYASYATPDRAHAAAPGHVQEDAAPEQGSPAPVRAAPGAGAFSPVAPSHARGAAEAARSPAHVADVDFSSIETVEYGEAGGDGQHGTGAGAAAGRASAAARAGAADGDSFDYSDYSSWNGERGGAGLGGGGGGGGSGGGGEYEMRGAVNGVDSGMSDSSLVISASAQYKAGTKWGEFLSNRHFRSLLFVYMVTFTSSFLYAIYLPTMPLYIKKNLKLDATFVGTVVAAYNLASLAFAPVMRRWASHRILLEPMLACILISVMAFLIYFFVAHPYAVLGSRILAGIGANATTIGNMFVTSSTIASERPRALYRLVICSVAGFILGSLAACLCGFVSFEVAGIGVNQYNVVGLVCVAVAALNLALCVALFREPSDEAKEAIRAYMPVDIIQERHPLPVWVGAWAWVLMWFACNYVWTVFEAINTLFVAHELGWEEQEIGLVWTGTGIVTLLLIMAYTNLSITADPMVLFYGFWVVLTASQAAMVHYSTAHVHYLQCFGAILLLTVGFMIERIVAQEGIDRLLGEGYRGSMMQWYYFIGRVGTVLGGPIGGVLFAMEGEDAAWTSNYLLLCFCLVCAIALHRFMFGSYDKGDVDLAHADAYPAIPTPAPAPTPAPVSPIKDGALGGRPERWSTFLESLQEEEEDSGSDEVPGTPYHARAEDDEDDEDDNTQTWMKNF